MTTALVWFRQELRLADNPALADACASHDRVVCVYVHAPREEGEWAPGAASRWWLHHSLAALDAELRKRGSRLVVRTGATLAALRTIARETEADAVYWNRRYEPAAVARDAKVETALARAGVAVEIRNGSLLHDPRTVATGKGAPYRVFTPFWRTVRAALEPRAPLAAPRAIASPSVAGATIASLRLLPRIAWDAGFAETWTPGEAGARATLRRFAREALVDYRAGRDAPAAHGTSRLSPHLHFGEISPMQVVWALQEGATSARLEEATEAYVRELGWREFSYHLLHHFPQSVERNLDARFDRFPWARADADALARWQRGRTGVPIVDAGMRELWTTGWMHNRVRMIVASYLTKNLRQHWLAGARWFWDTLVDADLANNTQGWQWTAGSGADAAPYFRVFNPVTQAARFDADADYIRRWVPELKRVPAPLIFSPWTDAATLKQTGYPAPLVDLAASRDAALAAYRQMRAEAPAA